MLVEDDDVAALRRMSPDGTAKQIFVGNRLMRNGLMCKCGRLVHRIGGVNYIQERISVALFSIAMWPFIAVVFLVVRGIRKSFNWLVGHREEGMASLEEEKLDVQQIKYAFQVYSMNNTQLLLWATPFLHVAPNSVEILGPLEDVVDSDDDEDDDEKRPSAEEAKARRRKREFETRRLELIRRQLQEERELLLPSRSLGIDPLASLKTPSFRPRDLQPGMEDQEDGVATLDLEAVDAEGENNEESERRHLTQLVRRLFEEVARLGRNLKQQRSDRVKQLDELARAVAGVSDQVKELAASKAPAAEQSEAKQDQ
jgi:hypothetical protein